MRTWLWITACSASIGLAPTRAVEDVATPTATLTCDPAAAPGRVRCEVEARVAPGGSIAWGDVVFLRAPPFAAPLRGRIGPGDATVRETSRWRWAFALVAHGPGKGDLTAQVRLVVCRGASCAPRALTAMGLVAVGPDP